MLFVTSWPAFKFYCENVLDGGGWALVRRVKQGTSWHPATDHLAGTQPAYGTYGGPTFDATFGRPYSTWVSSNTEFLFTSGMPHQLQMKLRDTESSASRFVYR
jgi:hypothetical protein